MKKVFYIILIIACIFIFLYSCIFRKDIVKINNAIFKVELAQTATEHYQGLSDRKDLKQNQGMLFVYENYQARTFIMRDMNFPLDIVWIKDDQVVSCEENVPVLNAEGSFSVVNSQEKVNYVLEIKAGQCKKFNIKKGDRVDIKLK